MKTLKKILKATVPMGTAGLMKVLVLTMFFVSLLSLNSYADDEKEAWDKLDILSTSSLKEYLKLYPDSKNSALANLALELQMSIQSVKTRATKPKLVIPFQDIGEHWTNSKSLLPDSGMLGLGYGLKVSGKDMYFVFSPIEGREIKVRNKNGARLRSLDREFLINPVGTKPAFPSGHGSLIAYKTGGAKIGITLRSCWIHDDGQIKLAVYLDGRGWFALTKEELTEELVTKLKSQIDSYYIKTTGNIPAIFGVVHGIGLVHLKGKATVTLPDGKEVEVE